MVEIKGFQPEDANNPKDWEIDLGLELSKRATQTDEMADNLDRLHNYKYKEVMPRMLESRKKYLERRIKAAKSELINLLKLGGIDLKELGLDEIQIQSADKGKMREIIKEIVAKLEEKIIQMKNLIEKSPGTTHPKKLFVSITLRDAIHLLDSRYI